MVGCAVAGGFFVVTVVCTEDVSCMMSVVANEGSSLGGVCFPLVYLVEVSAAEKQIVNEQQTDSE